MPARNIYHDAVIRALAADGWVVTDDPLDIRLMAFDDEKERIAQWKSWNATEK